MIEDGKLSDGRGALSREFEERQSDEPAWHHPNPPSGSAGRFRRNGDSHLPSGSMWLLGLSSRDLSVVAADVRPRFETRLLARTRGASTTATAMPYPIVTGADGDSVDFAGEMARGTVDPRCLSGGRL
jgi:hypothetical protein